MKLSFTPTLLTLVVSSFATWAGAQNLAVVNTTPIPLARFEVALQQASNGGAQPISDEQKAQLRNNVIDLEIFSQEARKLGLHTSESFKHQTTLLQQQALSQMFVQQATANIKVSDAEAKAEYDKAANQSSKEYLAKHILVQTAGEAQDLIKKINAGSKFEDLAKVHSKDPGSGANGGDLGWSPAERYVPEFAAALQQLQKGQLTPQAVKTQFGYHIIQLTDVRDGAKPQLPPFEQVKAQIIEGMKQQKSAELIDSIRSKAKIQ
jgi:peptidyl-prolyl cis-trans isomerase C